MFKKKNTEKEAEQMVEQDSTVMPEQQQQVYTMPDKYMPAQAAMAEAETKGKGKLFWVIVIILLALLIAAGSAAYVFISTGATLNSLFGSNTTKTTTTTTTTQQQQPTQQQTVTGSVAADTTTDEELDNTTSTTDEEDSTNTSIFPSTGQEDEEDTDTVTQGTTSSTQVGTTTTPSTGSTSSSTSSTTTTPQAFTLADQELASTTDRDRDDLTDIEEALYGTTATSPDSDSDGFLDSRELLGLYSPAAANTTLLQSGLVLSYSDDDLGWSIFYPASWFPETLSSASNEVLFTPDTVEGEFIEVLFEEKNAEETVVDWLTTTYPTLDENDLAETTVGDLEGVILPDGITHYLDAGEYVIGITYNAGTKEAVAFKTTFQMMVNSFEYVPAPTTTTADTQTDSTTTGSNTTDSTTN